MAYCVQFARLNSKAPVAVASTRICAGDRDREPLRRTGIHWRLIPAAFESAIRSWFLRRLRSGFDLSPCDVGRANPEGDRYAPLTSFTRTRCVPIGGDALADDVKCPSRVSVDKFLEHSLGDDASPSAIRSVFVDLKTDLWILTHHVDLLAFGRVDVNALRVPPVDDGHDVGLATHVAAHASDLLGEHELVNLARRH